MSTKDFTANVISATKVVPDGNFKDSKASGIWDINEALDLIKGGNWPNVANINPSAFVDALFSTFVYDGTSGTSLAINNGLDLTKGGLVWTKERSSTGGGGNILFSTDASGNHSGLLVSNGAGAAGTGYQPDYFTFRNNGYTTTNTVGDSKVDGREYVSWSFRKQPKFFDVVKYEGTGSARTVAHSLNTTVGMILIKNIDVGDNWAVYHRANTAAPQTDYLILNTTAATADDSAWWNDTAPTTSVFTVGTDHSVNADGENYVAYLFAHNDDDGGFGEPGDQDIIKCGGYTGTGNYAANEVNLGFEPQWLLIKKVTADGSNVGWVLVDNMRGWLADGGANWIYPNTNDAEQVATSLVTLTSTGFKPIGSSLTASTNDAFIYMAIRRGGMQTPTAASDVFSATGWTGNNTANRSIDNSILTDMVWTKGRSAATGSAILDRLRGQGNIVQSEGTGAEFEDDGVVTGLDFNTGFEIQTHSSINDNNATYISHAWARARGYFDIAAYTGTGSAGLTVNHNLGVVPEMMWVKSRSHGGNFYDWAVYHKDLGNTKYLFLNTTAAAAANDEYWNDTSPTSSVFSLGGPSTRTNESGKTYIAYHFATVANVSKVGSFTQSGATNVACGFTGSTPALIILKRTDATGNWFTFDSTRGIVAGNDKSLYMNTAGAEVTDADVVDPYSGGFATTSTLTDGVYIFYAIAATS